MRWAILVVLASVLGCGSDDEKCVDWTRPPERDAGADAAPLNDSFDSVPPHDACIWREVDL